MDTETNTHSGCVAVLPFENLSGDQSQDYFAEGFVEELITDFSHFAQLQVISSYTSRKMGVGARDARDEARKLSIDYLLKGKLLRLGGRLRIHIQLLDTRDGRVVCAERYDAPVDEIFEIQDDIVARVAAEIAAQIDKVQLAAARRKPITTLAAYDCWLRGMDQLRQGTLAADREARTIFQQALEIDPQYSRAYAGLSLSYFNEWSCNLWDLWEETQRKAYDYARQAAQLDDSDHIIQLVLGRILLYRHRFDQAEEHLAKSLTLNPNDADCLVQIASCKAYLGKPDEGEDHFVKALRLNPYRNIWYYPYGAFISFVRRNYEDCIQMAGKGPMNDVWVDLPAYIAAAHAYLKDARNAEHYLKRFQWAFQDKITSGRAPGPEEILRWFQTANPFRREEDATHALEGLVLAGLRRSVADRRTGSRPPEEDATASGDCIFRKDNTLWRLGFGHSMVTLPEVKGFLDLARLLAVPGKEMHCLEMQGGVGGGDAAPVLDQKARLAYEQRIRELRSEIEAAESMNDLVRREKSNAELDQLTEHLARALGVGRRSRKLDATVERARTAVTWRIRSAIKKIEAAHPSLGRHLTNSIRTGVFCSYHPEREIAWVL
jgi:TolB-like protein/Tfp pilus assembly protein PilF